ncbi:MAG: hypothetical protein IT495_13170 [Gammaproteobacteria bacterium]|nr:hypothetical protein [Gammaproteobacteria bacterium]
MQYTNRWLPTLADVIEGTVCVLVGTAAGVVCAAAVLAMTTGHSGLV